MCLTIKLTTVLVDKGEWAKPVIGKKKEHKTFVFRDGATLK